MRVLSVVPTLGLGGAETLAATLASELSACEFDSAVFVAAEIRGARGRELTARLSAAGVRVSVGGVRTPKHPLALIRCSAAIRELNPDVVICHLPAAEALVAAASAFSRRRLKAMRVLHTTGVTPLQQILTPIFDETVACSEEVARSARSINRPISIITNAISTADFPDLEEVGAPASAGHLAVVGHLREGLRGTKGLDIAVSAMSRLPSNFTLHVFGNRPEDGPLIMELARAEGVVGRVELNGVVPNLPQALSRLKPALAVMPSRREGMSMAMMEISCLGIPIVLSDIPAFRDPFEDEFIWRFCPPESPDGLARTLRDFGAPPAAARLRYAEAARAKFGSQRMAQQYVRLLRTWGGFCGTAG